MKTDILINEVGDLKHCQLGHLCWPGKKFDGATIAWPTDERASYFNVVDANNRITIKRVFMSPDDMEKLRKTGFIRVESGGLGAWSISAL